MLLPQYPGEEALTNGQALGDLPVCLQQCMAGVNQPGSLPVEGLPCKATKLLGRQNSVWLLQRDRILFPHANFTAPGPRAVQ